MIAQIKIKEKSFTIDFSKPVDISLPLKEGRDTVNAWWTPPVEITPVKEEGFIGSVADGGAVNFMNIKFNPHGNGTHTECVGHISAEKITINRCLKRFHFLAQLISVAPRIQGKDQIIMPDQVQNLEDNIEALIIRTLPNEESKKTRHYSGSNPPFLHHNTILLLKEKGIKHLLVDLPSIDKEVDDGKLLAHKAFWHYPEKPETENTITELIFVPNEAEDDLYVLNLQIASIESDASPSKPVLYKVIKS